MLSYHDRTPEEDEQILELYGIHRESSETGPLEKEKWSIQTGSGLYTFLSKMTGFFCNNNGEWTKERSEESHRLACGCVVTEAQQLVVCCYSDLPVCRRHAQNCQNCSRPTWFRHLAIIGGKAYCKNCVKTVRYKQVIAFLGCVIKTATLGLFGLAPKEREDSTLQGM